jgi:hypothetical protein
MKLTEMKKAARRIIAVIVLDTFLAAISYSVISMLSVFPAAGPQGIHV